MVYFSPMKAIFHLTVGSALTLGKNAAEASAAEADLPFLNAESLQRQEESILSSYRKNSWNHRSLQELNCMDDLYSGSAGCTANDLEFIDVTGIQVWDENAYFDEASGLWMDACLGNDDYVRISFTADIRVSNSRYDVGMWVLFYVNELNNWLWAILIQVLLCVYRYINTEGGSAYTGACAMSLLSNTDFKLGNTTAAPLEAHTNGADTVFIGELESPAKALGPDYCPDFTGESYLYSLCLFLMLVILLHLVFVLWS